MNACREEGPRYRVMQIIRGCDDDEVDTVLVGCLGGGHVRIGGVGALEKPGRSTFAGDLRVRGHCTRDDLCLAVELSGNAMHRSDKCATPAADDTGTQTAQWLRNCNVAHSGRIWRHGVRSLRCRGRLTGSLSVRPAAIDSCRR